jgi:hypothetical protein
VLSPETSALPYQPATISANHVLDEENSGDSSLDLGGALPPRIDNAPSDTQTLDPHNAKITAQPIPLRDSSEDTTSATDTNSSAYPAEEDKTRRLRGTTNRLHHSSNRHSPSLETPKANSSTRNLFNQPSLSVRQPSAGKFSLPALSRENQAETGKLPKLEAVTFDPTPCDKDSIRREDSFVTTQLEEGRKQDSFLRSGAHHRVQRALEAGDSIVYDPAAVYNAEDIEVNHLERLIGRSDGE